MSEVSSVTPALATSAIGAASRPSAVSEQHQFEAAVEPLMAPLLRYFTRRVVPTDDASDCLSETLLALRRHRNRLPANAEEQRAWAFGIARRIWTNHERKRVRRASARGQLDQLATQESGTTDRVLAALAELNPQDQELIRLVVWDGFGVGEAGSVMGLNQATARSRYARARARLRQLLDPAGTGEPSGVND